jgi:hypothetical protein
MLGYSKLGGFDRMRAQLGIVINECKWNFGGEISWKIPTGNSRQVDNIMTNFRKICCKEGT